MQAGHNLSLSPGISAALGTDHGCSAQHLRLLSTATYRCLLLPGSHGYTGSGSLHPASWMGSPSAPPAPLMHPRPTEPEPKQACARLTPGLRSNRHQMKTLLPRCVQCSKCCCKRLQSQGIAGAAGTGVRLACSEHIRRPLQGEARTCRAKSGTGSHEGRPNTDPSELHSSDMRTGLGAVAL